MTISFEAIRDFFVRTQKKQAVLKRLAKIRKTLIHYINRLYPAEGVGCHVPRWLVVVIENIVVPRKIEPYKLNPEGHLERLFLGKKGEYDSIHELMRKEVNSRTDKLPQDLKRLRNDDYADFKINKAISDIQTEIVGILRKKPKSNDFITFACESLTELSGYYTNSLCEFFNINGKIQNSNFYPGITPSIPEDEGTPSDVLKKTSGIPLSNNLTDSKHLTQALSYNAGIPNKGLGAAEASRLDRRQVLSPMNPGLVAQ